MQEEPYLPDVARAEWALHQCAGAPDQPADLATLALLTTHDPAQLHLVVAPGCGVVRSAWPIGSILGAHLEASPSLEEAGAQVRAGLAQDTVVWRSGWRPRVRLALTGEAEVLQGLLDGGSLAQALEAQEAASALDFGQWLPVAVQTGLVLAVKAVDT